MPLPSISRVIRIPATLLVAGAAMLAPATGAAAAGPSVVVIVSADGGAFETTLDIACESPAVPAADGVEVISAATAGRHDVTVPSGASTQIALPELADGSACAITESGPTAATLAAVTGGLRLTGADGTLRGVAVTVVRGSTVTAHLTHSIPVLVESMPPSISGDASTTLAGSGSAAMSLPLPASDEVASAATPVALAAARSTAASASTALPDTSGSTTTLVLASVGILICGATGYGLLLNSRRRERT